VNHLTFRRRKVVAASNGEERTRESDARDLSGISAPSHYAAPRRRRDATSPTSPRAIRANSHAIKSDGLPRKSNIPFADVPGPIAATRPIIGASSVDIVEVARGIRGAWATLLTSRVHHSR
jgi:hypothetical protein